MEAAAESSSGRQVEVYQHAERFATVGICGTAERAEISVAVRMVQWYDPTRKNWFKIKELSDGDASMRVTLWMLLPVVFVTGCVSKPDPWTPGDLGLADALPDAEVLFEEGITDADGPDAADTHELDVADDEETAVPPDGEVLLPPGVGPAFSPVGFTGSSTGGGLTLHAIGPSGRSASGFSQGGDWQLRNGAFGGKTNTD